MRIERQGVFFQHFQRLRRLEVRPHDVGLGQPGVEQVRIELQRPADFGLRLGDIVLRQPDLSQRGMHLGRLRIDVQGPAKFLGGVGIVVFFEKQLAGLVFCRPEVGLQLESVGIKLVHQKIELVRLAIPTREQRGRPADPTQRLGIVDLVVVVIADQPPAAVLGLVQTAVNPMQLDLNPAGKRLLRVELQRRIDLRLGFLVIAPLERQPGKFREQQGILILVFEILENFDGRLVLPVLGMAGASPSAASAFSLASGANISAASA